MVIRGALLACWLLMPMITGTALSVLARTFQQTANAHALFSLSLWGRSRRLPCSLPEQRRHGVQPSPLPSLWGSWLSSGAHTRVCLFRRPTFPVLPLASRSVDRRSRIHHDAQHQSPAVVVVVFRSPLPLLAAISTRRRASPRPA